MNSSNARFKMSKIERETNKQIIIVFVVQVICCFIGAICGTVWQTQLKENNSWYLGIKDGVSAWDNN